MNYFQLDDPDYLRRYSGLAQFVLLMSLTPFIFSYQLFSLGSHGLGTPYFEYAADLQSFQTLSVNDMFGSVDSGDQGNENAGIAALLALGGVAVLYAFAVLRSLWKRRFGWLLFGLVIPNAVLLAVVGLPMLDESTLTAVLPKVALVWFALRGRVLSRSFAAFLALVLGGALLFASGSVASFSLLQTFMPLVVFLLAVTVLRVLIMVVNDNFYFLKSLGAAQGIRTFIRSLLLWLPLTLLSAPYFWVNAAVEEWARNEIRSQGMLCAWDDDVEFREYAMLSVACRNQQAQNALDSRIAGYDGQLLDMQNAGLQKLALAEFDLAMPAQIDFEPANSSGWFAGLKDFAIDTSHDTFNAGYGQIRESVRNRVESRAGQLAGKFDATIDGSRTALETLHVQLTRALQDANRDVQLVLYWMFAFSRGAHLLMLLVFAFMALKAFLYVYARVAFHRQTGAFLTLGNATGAASDASASPITQTVGEYTITADIAPATYYLSRRFQGRGKAPKFAIPQPLGAPIARLLHHATVMNRVDMRPGDGPVRYTATQGAHFLKWQLGDGEVVLFDVRNFVGMSSTIKLSTLISTRLSTLLLGKFIFSSARGPGDLILLTEGRAEIAEVSGKVDSLPPEQLVAMHLDTRMHIESEQGPIDIYLSTAYVQPAGGGRIIVDVDRQNTAATGLSRFFLHFIWPG